MQSDNDTPRQANGKRLIVFSDDWGRHPSSCQHLMKRFLSSHHVTWVNTIGMRPPRFDWLTVKRGFEKIGGWILPSHKQGEEDSEETNHVGPNPDVYDSKMWPWMSGKSHRAINRWLLTRQLSELAKDATVLTTIPIVADLVDTLGAKRWVYYCVDDFSVWPGLSGDMLGQMEDELLPKMDRIVAVSETLQHSIAQRGYTSELLSHGVDIEFWREAVGRPADADFEAPVFLFWGVVDQRMNADWILALAERMESGTILLLGPQQDPDPRLAECSRVSMPGPVAYESLAGYANLADVLIMPYIDAPVTRAMQPLKLKEYLATERPVVATSLPSVEPWSDCLDAVDSIDEFIEHCFAAVNHSDTSARVSHLRERLCSESWDAKADRFAAWLDAN
ncbi:MAG: glycosyltransferase [Planctomycetota bacterium]